MSHPPPPLAEGTTALVRRASALAHWCLYGLMLALPISGWLMSSAKGVPTVWFGVVPLPDVLPRDKALGDALKEVHESLALALIALALLHAAAALKHQLIDRDGLLYRMWPRASLAKKGTQS